MHWLLGTRADNSVWYAPRRIWKVEANEHVIARIHKKRQHTRVVKDFNLIAAQINAHQHPQKKQLRMVAWFTQAQLSATQPKPQQNKHVINQQHVIQIVAVALRPQNAKTGGSHR